MNKSLRILNAVADSGIDLDQIASVGDLIAQIDAIIAGPEGAATPEGATDKLTKLTAMLNDPAWDWRKLSTLAQAIGESEADTMILLARVRARAARDTGNALYGLVSRVGP